MRCLPEEPGSISRARISPFNLNWPARDFLPAGNSSKRMDLHQLARPEIRELCLGKKWDAFVRIGSKPYGVPMKEVAECMSLPPPCRSETGCPSGTGDVSFLRLKEVPLGRARLHAVTERQCTEIVMDALAARRGGWILTMNLDILRRFHKDPACKRVYEGADLVVADGKPVLWACRILGSDLPQRVSGSSLLWSLSAAAALQGKSVFLLGGRPGTAERAADVLKKRSPGLVIAGIRCPEPGFEEDPDRSASLMRSVAETAPDIVYVALGSPKQERLIARLREVHPSAWYIGVGIGFSYLSGDVRRAPVWMQEAGLEWTYRLAQEPRRLSGRYLIHGIPYGLSLLGRAFWKRITRNRARRRVGMNGTDP